jgi:spore maturation protein CgeD
MTPKVSILMTCYNKPEWLKECIDSVINQTFTDWELLIFDDNSPDPEVFKILDQYVDHPQVAIWNSLVTEDERYETARYATLINAMFPWSKGEYITYLVDDDKYYPDRLQVLVDHMDANPDHQVVYHPLYNIDADGNPGGVRGIKGILDGKTDETKAFDYVDHNMVMHTRQAFIDAGGWYDVKGVWGGADAYFWRRLNEAGYLFYPVGDNSHPLAGKRYHHKNVQTMMVENRFFPK